MKQNDDDEKLLTRYLFGELSEAEQTRLEERLFADDEYFERIAAVECDLIDEYVRAELAPHEHARFENHFLLLPGRRRRVELARSELKTISELAAEMRSEPAPTRRNADLLRRFWAGSPALRFALAALALLAVAVGPWLMVERRRLQAKLALLQTERQAWQQEGQVRQQEMAQQREREGRLAVELQREQSRRSQLEQELAAKPPSRPTFVSFVLPSVARDPARAKNLIFPTGARTVQLQIDLEDADDYQSYRAVLQTTEGHTVWSQDRVLARRTNWGRIVVLRLPVTVLAPGGYELELLGVVAPGKSEEIGYYYFSVLKN